MIARLARTRSDSFTAWDQRRRIGPSNAGPKNNGGVSHVQSSLASHCNELSPSACTLARVPEARVPPRPPFRDTAIHFSEQDIRLLLSFFVILLSIRRIAHAVKAVAAIYTERYRAEPSPGRACKYLPVVATEAWPRVACTR